MIKDFVVKYCSTFLIVLLATPTVLHSAPFDRFQDCEACPEMIELPLGAFTMGSEQPNPFFVATPPREIVVDRRIAMGTTEVTIKQWRSCVEEGGCDGYMPETEKKIYDNMELVERIEFPEDAAVGQISFLQAQAYVDWLNSKVGGGFYRLPTSPEWEYAARAGTQTVFPFGDDLSILQANYDGYTELIIKEKTYQKTEPAFMPVSVFSLDAENVWGFRHMAGNVWEWTQTCYSEQFPLLGEAISEWLENDKTENCKPHPEVGSPARVIRGGGYFSKKEELQSHVQAVEVENRALSVFGFRVVKDLVRENLNVEQR